MRFSTLAAIAVVLPTIAGPLLTSSVLAQDDPVVATVNGNHITRSEVEQAYVRLPEQYRQAPMEAVFEPLSEQMIDGELILEQAVADDLASDPDIAAEIENARANVIRQALVGRAIDAAMTDEALQAAYEEKKSDPAFTYEEVKARHILVAEEAEAIEVIAALDAGGDFEELAKEKSTGPSGPNGGDLGYFQQGAMVPEFGDAAFAMEPGTYTKEPVKTDFGYHVIMVEDKRNSNPSFAETEQEIRQALAETTITDLVDSLREGAEIERFNMDGSAIETAEEPEAEAEAETETAQ